MGIASLILGIISILIAPIPFCGSVAFAPALIGLILGIAFLVGAKKRSEPLGIGIAGTILNAISLSVIVIWTIILVSTSGNSYEKFSDAVEEAKDSLSVLQDSIVKEISEEFSDAIEEEFKENK